LIDVGLPRRILQKRFVAFLLVGALNTVFGYAVFFLVSFAGLHYAFTVLVSTCIGVVFNFATTGRLVFRTKDNRLFMRFGLVYTAIYAINVGMIRLLKIWIEPILLIQALLAFPLAVLSYTLNRVLVFAGTTTTRAR
jgi:putative flippase GtrA